MKSKFQVDQINTMLKHLLMAFKYCNMYNDLKDMIYNPETESVEVIYWMNRQQETAKLDVNVACDSYSAMIHDVEQRVYKFFS